MSFAKIAAIALCASAVTLSCRAEKPDWVGGRGHQRDQLRDEMHEPAGYGAEQDRGRRLRHEGNQSQPGDRSQFGDRHRESVRDYLEPRVRAGRCPPGLAKKRNGCLPPGQARKWRLGQQLPRDLMRYPLPVELRHQSP